MLIQQGHDPNKIKSLCLENLQNYKDSSSFDLRRASLATQQSLEDYQDEQEHIKFVFRGKHAFNNYVFQRHDNFAEIADMTNSRRSSHQFLPPLKNFQ